MNAIVRMLLLLGFVVTISSLTFAEKDAKKSEDPDLAKDLKELQGTWERGRQIKVIKGNQETLTNYDGQGKVRQRQTVEFKLEKSGDVRIFTFGPLGQLDNPKQTYSYIYKIDGDTLFDAPGLFPSRRSYQTTPAIFEWYRKREDPADEKTPAEN